MYIYNYPFNIPAFYKILHPHLYPFKLSITFIYCLTFLLVYDYQPNTISNASLVNANLAICFRIHYTFSVFIFDPYSLTDWQKTCFCFSSNNKLSGKGFAEHLH
jgi:hypothetical protein